jgi:hypothetical protein
MDNRRELTFATLDEVMPEVERLLGGHTTVGNWTLGQMCNHLALGIRMSVDGHQGPGAPWLLRKTLAPIILWQIFRSGKMRPGFQAPEAFLPKSGLDDRTEAEALRAVLAEFAARQEPMADHPFFGRMTRAQLTRLHLIHCAHHLSFAQPAASAVEKAG